MCHLVLLFSRFIPIIGGGGVGVGVRCWVWGRLYSNGSTSAQENLSKFYPENIEVTPPINKCSDVKVASAPATLQQRP